MLERVLRSFPPDEWLTWEAIIVRCTHATTLAQLGRFEEASVALWPPKLSELESA